MLSQGLLKDYKIDATQHPNDPLEVKLLKDEVANLRNQLS